MYKKRLFLSFVFLLLILASGCTITGRYIADKNDYSSAAIEDEIEEKLKTEEEVYVIVKLKDAKLQQEKVLSRLNLEKKNAFGILTQEPDFKLKHKYSTVNAFSGKITKQGLEKLRNDPDVENIYIDKKFSIALDNSIPQINADDVWQIQVNSTNITGLGETVCIIDTGVDYNHSDLGSGWGNKVIGGYRSLNNGADQQECSQNPLACFDDEGHGTHVAGIVSSNNNIYRGVAPDAKITAVKVLDSSGSGWASDIIAGIDWCVNNASKFNISVISMSLGDCSNHSTYCNDDPMTPYINAAVAKNITVIVSAGNGPVNGCTGITNTAGPSSPACVENATAIGAVNDADSIFYQRGALFELLAPGISIHSTQLNGGFTDKSGTSMAAPHAAGAAALLQQFNKLQNGNSLTPAQIKEALNDTGIIIDDSAGSGYNFSRIDIYAAVQSLNFVAPYYLNITLISTDLLNRTNGTLIGSWDYFDNQTDNETKWYNNSIEVESLANLTSISSGNTTRGQIWIFSARVYDSINWSNWTNSSSITIQNTPPEITPINNISVNASEIINITVNASDLDNDNLTYVINNTNFNKTNNNFVWNTTINDSGIHTINITVSDNSSNISQLVSIAVRLDQDKDGYGIACLLGEDCDDNNISKYPGAPCSRSCYSGSAYDANCACTGGTYICGGGGGDSSSDGRTYTVNLENKYTKTLSIKDKINFQFKSQSHSATVSAVTSDYVDLIIQSAPVLITVYKFETKKMDLDSDDFYDLSITLNDIIGSRADLTFRLISEPVFEIFVEEEIAEEIITEDVTENITEGIALEEPFKEEPVTEMPAEKVSLINKLSELSIPEEGIIYIVLGIFLVLFIILLKFKSEKKRFDK